MTVASRVQLNIAMGCIVACASSGTAERGTAGSTPPAHCMVRTTQGHLVEEIKAPPLLDLLLHPEAYDGCRVIVCGFFGSSTYPGGTLYLSREDQVVGGSLFGSLPISFTAKNALIDFKM